MSVTMARDAKGLKKHKFEFIFKNDIINEFLEVLQWSLFILTRSLPDAFKPIIEIPEKFQKTINDPVPPGQFVIDRFVFIYYYLKYIYIYIQ